MQQNAQRIDHALCAGCGGLLAGVELMLACILVLMHTWWREVTAQIKS